MNSTIARLVAAAACLVLSGCGAGSFSAEQLEDQLVKSDWPNGLAAKSADCDAVDVDARGVGIYSCAVTFLAIADPVQYRVEVDSDGRFSALPDLDGITS